MFPPSPLIRLGLALLGLLLPVAAQTTVYSVPAAATNTYPSMIIHEDTEYGSAVQLAGTDRYLQSASVSVYSSIARSAEVTLSIYEAIPELRYPPTVGSSNPLVNLRPADTPLWSSGPLDFNFTSGGATGLALNKLLFSGINTLVPNQLFWVISFDDLSTSAGTFGPKLGSASSVTPSGAINNPNHIYIRTPDQYDGAWVPGTLPGNNLALTIDLKAIPEPSVTVMIAGVAFFAASRRRRMAA